MPSTYGSGHYGADVYRVYLPVDQPPGRVLWLVLVDWERDGTFSGGFESYMIRSLRYKRGRDTSRIRGDGNGQNHPEIESFDVEIYDPDGRYDVFNSTSAIYDKFGSPGFLAKIVTYNTTTGESVVAFTGTLTGIEWDEETKIGTLSGTGLSRYMELGTAANVYPPHQAMSEGFYDACFVMNGTPPTPYPWNYWKGQTGGLRLDACAGILMDRMGWQLGYELSTTIGTNEPTFYMLDGKTGWEHLVELADGFAARIFFLADGTVYLLDKDDADARGTVTPPSSGALRSFGRTRTSPFESLFNRINVRVRTHVSHMFKTPLYNGLEAWSNGGPIKVPAATAYEFWADIGGGSGKVLGSNFVQKDDINWHAFPNEDKSGTELSKESDVGYTIELTNVGTGPLGIVYQLTGENQNKVLVRLQNYSSTQTAYFFDLKIKACGVYEPGNNQVITVDDTASITLNGLREMTISNRLVQTEELANSIGDAMLAATSTRDTASVVTLGYAERGEAVCEMLKDYDLGNLVDFGTAGGATSLKNYGMSGANNLIVGQEVEWMEATGQNVTMRLTFEKMPE